MLSDKHKHTLTRKVNTASQLTTYPALLLSSQCILLLVTQQPCVRVIQLCQQVSCELRHLLGVLGLERSSQRFLGRRR